MMRIAFYAPMKAPDHPVPSGDRRMARLLIRALRRSGHEVHLASRLRSYDRNGEAARQRRLRRHGARLATRYIARHQAHPPDLWFTYHVYHKAPDWLGPAVSKALSIPYVVADASIAPKQADGPWADGHRAATAAVTHADRVLAFDPTDMPCVTPHLAHPNRLVPMSPFVDVPRHRPDHRARHRQVLAAAHGLDPDTPWLAAVGMMRPGAKCDSYRVLASALERLDSGSWSLLVAGHGAARSAVEAMFRCDGRTWFLGRLDHRAIRGLYQAVDLAVWPAVGEGYCMALLEAQAAGVPVVAGKRAGIAQIVADGETGLLTPVGDSTAFAGAVRTLISAPGRRAAMAAAARDRARRHLDMAAAARRLDGVLGGLRREAGG